MKRIWMLILPLLLNACGVGRMEKTILYSGRFSDVTAQLLGGRETGRTMTLELLREDGTVSQSFDLSGFGGVMVDRGVTWDDLNGDEYPDFYAVKWTAASNWAYACWRDGELVCLREIKKDRAEDGSMVFTYTVTDDPMGAARVVWQARCMAGAGEEAELNAELERYMDCDDKG